MDVLSKTADAVQEFDVVHTQLDLVEAGCAAAVALDGNTSAQCTPCS
jgi:hypothetical protein